MSTNAVDEVTDSVAKTGISDDAGQHANGATANNDAVAASVAEGRRLYVGNLAYATTDEELKAFFKDFSVESVSIPRHPRNGRPVGYAFVDLAAQAEVEKAMSELSGKEVLQRKVSVQLARKYDANEDKGEDGANAGENASGGEGGRRRFSGRGRGRGRGRYRNARGFRSSRPRTTEDGQADGNEAPTNVPGQVDPLVESTNESGAAKDGNQETTTGGQTRNGRSRGGGPYQRKQRGPPEDGIVSKNKVMVANLPYDYTEAKLKELFGDYEPSLAKIALRPIPRFMVRKLQARNEPRKGRGFGFVTLGSEEMQQKAIEDMNGKDVEGREIAVKVAIDSPGKEDEDGNAEAVDGDEQAGEGATDEQATTA